MAASEAAKTPELLEMIRLLLDAGAKVIGVNCRDLRTFSTDTSITADLIGRIPDGIVRIAESGMSSSADLLALRSAGVDGFLVGESLMRAERPGEKLRELIAG